MKLLLDENLSRRLVPALNELFPGTSQVDLLSLNNSDDREIWSYAQREGFAIVTQDADFQEQSLLSDGPPLIIWLRCGNQPRKIILDKLISCKDSIEKANLDPEVWCIELY